jgi:hypothetical protein
MVRVIPKEEIRARTEAMRRAIPEDQRAAVADEIRRYANDIESCYRQITESLRERFGAKAEVVIRELNRHECGWERDVADRLEGRKDD